MEQHVKRAKVRKCLWEVAGGQGMAVNLYFYLFNITRGLNVTYMSFNTTLHVPRV